jgi:glycerol-3-phosphate dehydrogenase
MVSQGKNHTHRRKPLGKRIKKSVIRKIAAMAERVDFVRLLRRISESDAGQPWLDRFSDIPNDWPNQEGLDALAVKLTMEQLAEEGTPADQKEIEQLVSEVTHGYDRNLHVLGSASVTTLMNGLYDQTDPTRPFVSPDGRDLAHLEELKEFRKQGLGVVYLVNHSSHLDEFLVDVVAMHFGLGLPLFAAGQNMMAIESLAKVLRLGSYIVQRRGASRPALSALFNFCRAVSEVGNQQAIFLEAWHGGARSRDGSLRYPRRLVTLRGAIATDKDVVVQPVAVSYSIVPEDLSLAARKGARCWVRGLGFWRTLARIPIHPRSWVWRSAQNLYGRAIVTMPKPVLLSQLKERHDADFGGLVLDEYVALYAIREIARTKKVMASQLVARGLMRARRQALDSPSGDAKPDLAAAVEYEKKLLFEYHQSTFGQDPDLEDFIRNHPMEEVVSDGLKTLKKRGVLQRWTRDEHGLPGVKNEAGLAFYATHGDRRIYSPTADQNIVVVGANDWGFALTSLVGNRMLEEKRYLNASLTLYDSRPEVAQEMGITRHPVGRFEEYRLPKNAFVTSDPTSAFRKASEVILASAPRDVPAKARFMLEHAEQKLRVIVVTCGFEPESRRLPTQIIYDIARELGRTDVEVYSMVGPVREEDLVDGLEATGILGGPIAGGKELADLFSQPPLGVVQSDDPLGIQAAAILARVYAMWANIKMRKGELEGSARVGHFSAQAGGEAAKLVVTLGGKAESMSVGSPAWTAIYAAEGLAGSLRDYARKVVSAAKKSGDLAKAAEKVVRQMADQGIKLQTYYDLDAAKRIAQRAGLDLPLLSEAHAALWGKAETNQ